MTVYVAVEEGMNEIPFVTPPVQVYVVAPPPFSVTDSPWQTVVALAVVVTAGTGLTVIVLVAVAEQPAVVPVTVYVVVAEGMNETPFVTPPVQVYEAAPPPFSVTDCPWQTVVALAVLVTVGTGLTVINRVAVAEQPAAVPVTV